MNNLEELKKQYKIISAMDSIAQIEPTFKFVENLLSENDLNTLSYHYGLLKNKKHIKLYQRIRAAFDKRPQEIIEPFLLEKLQKEEDVSLKADVIQLLGNMGSEKVLPYAIENIQSDIRDIRYRCIIVVGWIGGKNDLPVLNERLQNEPDQELRGYAATAMRQLWFKKKVTSEDILPYLYAAIPSEESEETLGMIIIVIQELLKKKFGMQELINDATIKGDAFKAKEKVLKFIEKNS